MLETTIAATSPIAPASPVTEQPSVLTTSATTTGTPTSTEPASLLSKPDPVQAAPAPAAPVVEDYSSADIKIDVPESEAFPSASMDSFKNALVTSAKELGISKDKAQQLAQKLTAAGVEASTKIKEDYTNQWNARVKDWADQSRKDPEIGGDRLEANLSVAEKAVEAFGGDEVRSILKEMGMGNHPAVIKMFYKIGKAMSEDSFVRGRAALAPTRKPPEQRMYPNMNP